MAELTSVGLVIDRFPDILSGIVADEQSNINPNISVNDDEFLGQLNNILTERFASTQELIQAVYDSQIIDKAEGKNLDDLAALRNVTRIQAVASFTERQQFIGTDGTTVLAESLFENPITGDQFTNPTQINVSTLACLSADFTVKQVMNATDYSIQVNSTTYTYTSDANATANEIVSDFNSQINADASATWSSSLDGDVLTILSDDQTPISIVTISYIGPDSVTVEGRLECTVTGGIVAPPNSVNTAISVIPGLTSTTNITAYILGSNLESDEDLRVRIKSATSGNSTGTIPSIQNALLANVTGVSSAQVIENVEAVPDVDGRPAHSYEVIVVGGDNDEVAAEIWRTKPAGIGLFGSTTVVIIDSSGVSRTIKFTRPSVINIAVNVEYTLYSEEIFPSSGQDLVKAAVLNYINDLETDVDVIPNRISAAIVNADIPGIEELTIEIQTLTNPGDVPNPVAWQTTKIAINEGEYANTTLPDVYVTEV